MQSNTDKGHSGTGSRKSGGTDGFFDELDRKLARTKENVADTTGLQRRYSIIETLLAVSTSFSSNLDMSELLERIVDAVVRITDCERGYLVLRDEGGELSFALGRSKSGEALTDKSFEISRSVVRGVANTGEAQVVMNAQEDAELKGKRSIVELQIRTVICLPLKFEDHLVGVIYADSGSVSETFTSSDISIMNAFGTQAAIAIENARRHGDLELIKSSLENQNLSLRSELAERYEFAGIVGYSKRMRDIFDVIRKVAPLSTTVLIQGETGTGKELIAKAIHYNSPRKSRAIVSINCGALPKDILESELYGYRRGAFTGADQDRGGLFEAADKGTLFLDEIGEMPVELQVKLLRSLQEGEVRRLGEDFSRPVDVRIISSTNKDLAAEVDAGRFRSDLYYRLNVVPISLPPLRERPEDILPLAEHFIDRFSKEMKKRRPSMSRATKELIVSHRWRGNVRELENSIERAIALGEGRKVLDAAQFSHISETLPVEARATENASLKSMIVDWEKEVIRKVLIKNGWNVSRTAIVLQISRQQLHNKIKRFQLRPIV